MKVEYVESVELSDLGRRRKNNEDACLRIPDKGLYCVADGMGGVAGGDLASETITTSLQEAFAQVVPGECDSLSGRVALLRKAANRASKWIKNFADEKALGQMGSTVVALVFSPRHLGRAACLHAGDSRLYRYRGGGLQLLTSDHTAVAALAAKLGRDPASLPAKYQNELLNAVGLNESVELEKTPVEVLSEDLFLLCSDGLTRMLPDEVIAGILKAGQVEGVRVTAEALVKAANEAGGKDNITVVLVRVGDLRGLPVASEPEEEDECRTVLAPGGQPVAETPVPSTPASQPSGFPETPVTGQEDTPRTDDDHTLEQTPTPVIWPAGQSAGAEASRVTGDKAGEIKPGKTKGIVIITVMALVISVGVLAYRGTSSKLGIQPPVSGVDSHPTNRIAKISVAEAANGGESVTQQKRLAAEEAANREGLAKVMDAGRGLLMETNYAAAAVEFAKAAGITGQLKGGDQERKEAEEAERYARALAEARRAEGAAAKAPQSPMVWTNDLGMVFAKVPGEDFWIGTMRITPSQYEQVCGRLLPGDCKGEEDGQSFVRAVSYEDVRAFPGKLTARAKGEGGLPPGCANWHFALPTPAQWSAMVSNADILGIRVKTLRKFPEWCLAEADQRTQVYFAGYVPVQMTFAAREFNSPAAIQQACISMAIRLVVVR